MSLYRRFLPYVLGISIFSGCSTINQFDVVTWRDPDNPEKYKKIYFGNKRVESDASRKEFSDYGKIFLIEEGKNENTLYMNGSEVSKLSKDSRIVIVPQDRGIVVYVDGNKINIKPVKLEEIASSD